MIDGVRWILARCAGGRRSFGALVGLTAAANACGGGAPPDPRIAAREYSQAAMHADADALYAMMSTAARREQSVDDVRRTVGEQRGELEARGREFASRDLHVDAVARLRFGDGEEVSFSLADGAYRVQSAGVLPGGAHTPAEALEQLRRALARRSYAGLMRVLTPATRAAVEQDLRSLVDGLERPATLPVQLMSDKASVEVPGGHHVKLRRDGGLWRVDDFD